MELGAAPTPVHGQIGCYKTPRELKPSAATPPLIHSAAGLAGKQTPCSGPAGATGVPCSIRAPQYSIWNTSKNYRIPCNNCCIVCMLSYGELQRRLPCARPTSEQTFMVQGDGRPAGANAASQRRWRRPQTWPASLRAVRRSTPRPMCVLMHPS